MRSPGTVRTIHIAATQGTRMEQVDTVRAAVGRGLEGDRELPQYMLSEDEDQAPSECPISITRNHPKPAARLP